MDVQTPDCGDNNGWWGPHQGQEPSKTPWLPTLEKTPTCWILTPGPWGSWPAPLPKRHFQWQKSSLSNLHATTEGQRGTSECWVQGHGHCFRVHTDVVNVSGGSEGPIDREGNCLDCLLENQFKCPSIYPEEMTGIITLWKINIYK